jgi:glycosyltransferase involved in cell wall biosynthesis
MLRGLLEIANTQEVLGWAWRDSTPEARVSLDIIIDDVLVACIVADTYRLDLREAGIGDGGHGFYFKYPNELSVHEAHVVRVRDADNHADEIRLSPFQIEPVTTFEALFVTDGETTPSSPLPPEQLPLDLTPPEPHLQEPKMAAAADEGSNPSASLNVIDFASAGRDAAPKSLHVVPQPVLEGNVDAVAARRISGWALDSSKPDTPISLLVTDNDVLLGRVLANKFRFDLEHAGKGTGRCAFEIDLKERLSPFEHHEIRIRRESDGAELHGSPVIIEPSRTLDASAKEFLARFFDQAQTAEDITSTVEFTATETAKLVARLTGLHGKVLERAEYRQFLNRWRRRLPDAEAALAAQTAPKQILRALVVDDFTPKMDRDAGSNAILSHALSFQRLGYEIAFAPALEMRNDSTDVAHLDALGIRCCRVPFYSSVEDVLAGQAGEFDVIYLHRVQNAAKYSELARAYCPKARLIYSVADLHHIRVARQAVVEKRPELELLSQRLKRTEFLAAAGADAVITHSTFEAAELGKYLPATKIYIIPWAIQPHPIDTPFAQRADIAFIGGYSHQPNLDAAHRLISEIMPRVRKLDPAIKCLLVGSDMPDGLRQSCANGVEAVGHVENLSSVFNRVRLTVAPLAFGAGVKGKVLESLAAGLPCVCSSIAAEGIALPAPLQAFVTDDADRMAAAIHHLHADESANKACGDAGLAFIETSFSAGSIDALIEKAVGFKQRL